MPGLLLRRWLRLCCNPPLVFSVLLLCRLACWVRWVLHPVSGSSHGVCDCSLGDSVGVSYGSPFLSSFVSCSVISSCGSQPLWVLCSVHCLVSLALGWVSVLSSRFRWLRMARGGCCLRFVQGHLPQAGAVFLGMRQSWWLSLLLSGRPCAFALGSSSLGLV